MPRKIERLKREALQACRWRGHTMGRFQSSEWYPRRAASATCKCCGATVGVNAKPQPNEIDIGGNAVGLNCPVEAD